MVLGLTMAETMLLLVFCLLIAAASIVFRKGVALNEAVKANAALTDSLREAQSQIEVMQTHLPGGVITNEWQHLVRDYPAIEKLQKAGVPLKEAGDATDIVAEAMKAHRQGLTAGDVTRSITLREAVRKEFQSTPGGLPTDEQITSLIREGLQIQTATAKDGGKGKHDWPPIITISDAEGNYFATGSAVLSDAFRAALKVKVDELLRNIEAYPDVNVIEIIGYTDERPLGGQLSNLDAKLVPVLRGKESVAQLKSIDNAGLGLARAVSVTQLLLADERLARFKGSILPYSGAQLVNVNDTLALGGTGGDVKERRRIEIRLRQSARVNFPLSTDVEPPASVFAKKTTAASPLASSPVDSPRQVDTAPAPSEVDTAEVLPQQPSKEAVNPPRPGLRILRWIFQN
jgi:outer membrane protein OmpA-like peptidoglycan-associated protein